MTTRWMATAALAALLAGTPAGAQQQPTQKPMQHPAQKPMPHAMAQKPAQAGPMQGMSGMSCMDMLGGPTPAMVLHHEKALGLSSQQLERLRALAKQDSATAAPHMREAMAAHEAAAQVLKAEHPDFAAYEARLNEAAHHMIAGHVVEARSAIEARDLLTAEQRTRLQADMKRMMGEGMGKGMGKGTGMGMQGMGMQGMGGMMGGMECMGMMSGMQGGMMEHPRATGAAPAAQKPQQH